MRKICFVTEECSGITSAGGIGTCVGGLATYWSSLGREIDILITDGGVNGQKVTKDAIKIATRVLTLSDLAEADKDIYPPVDAISKSYHVYRYLREQDYDEVHFNDWMGSGFYTAMARRQGLFDATVITHLHGSSEWTRTYNLHPPELEDLEREAIERSQIENSDLVISPSRYLLDWYIARGIKLPKAIQRQWILPQWIDLPPSMANGPLRTRPIEAKHIREIVFFGRHERRKGFEIFVEAIARLPGPFRPDLTFVGRFDRIAREFTGSHVFRKLGDYPGAIRFINDLDQAGALALLRRSEGALAVMPSLIENSPCVVGECFTLGIPFLTTDVGGVAELIDPDSRGECLAKPTPAALSEAIARVLSAGMPAILSTLTPRRILENWTEPAQPRAASASGERPLVSVCFTHYERPHLLRRAYEAILEQTYDNIEIIIVDDGSRSTGAHDYLDSIEAAPGRFPVTVIRSSNKYLGAARNLAASRARGEFVLFHDDDNFAEPDEIKTFVAAALAYGADVLTAQAFVFHDGEYKGSSLRRRIEHYPIGIGGVFSFFRNRFGDANALVRRSVFNEIGGFSEVRDAGWEDWEFFLKAYLRNYRLGVVPEPLFNYRASGTGMLATGNPLVNYERLYKAIDEYRPSLGSEIFRYAQRGILGQQVLDLTWEVLSRERCGDLHQRLTACNPNSGEALALLSDLAFALGRYAEAIDLGSRSFEQREKLAPLLANIRPGHKAKPKWKEVKVVAPDPRREAVFLQGWMVDANGEPANPTGYLIDGQWFHVEELARYDRPDVQKALGLSSAANLGFKLCAIASPRPATSPFKRVSYSSVPMSNRLDFGDLLTPMLKGRACRSHIDDASWQQRLVLDFPADGGCDYELEIETATPASTAVVWAKNDIDFGKRISDRRTRFAKPTHDEDKPASVTALVPSGVRSHIMIG